MPGKPLVRHGLALTLLSLTALPAMAQSFRVQCPTSTITHPNPASNNSEPSYSGPTTLTTAAVIGTNGGYLAPSAGVNGAIKCQQISGGDGYATMGDGTQTYMFSFGPLSGLGKIATGQPGTDFPIEFNSAFQASAGNMRSGGTTPPTALVPGDPATTIDTLAGVDPSQSQTIPLATVGGFYNGAVGLATDTAKIATIFDISESGNTVTVVTNSPMGLALNDQVVIAGTGAAYDGTWAVTAVNVPNAFFPSNFAFQYTATSAGLADVNESTTATASTAPAIDGHVDPRQIMDVGVMNGNIPAPLIAIDEDDELFLTLTNVGMIMRPDLFEQHTVHFHGYPNASGFYDGVPDASVAINIAASFTYYYLAPDAGTYFWHCHITPPEHLQMGMVGQIFVRPRQDRVPVGSSLYLALAGSAPIGGPSFVNVSYAGQPASSVVGQQSDLRTACNSSSEILCSNPPPPPNAAVQQTDPLTGAAQKYAYNDGDGSTAYDVEYPVQIHGFDPNFHFVGMTFNPEGFADMKDKYFLLNGRSYPDTDSPGPLQTQSADGVNHFSQPLPAIINIPAGGRALLRISDLDVTEYQTLASLGIPMKVIAINAKLLRDQAGNNLYYNTNSITLGGGESLDVILDTSVTKPDGTNYKAGEVYYLYTPNLDHLSNDAENFGGLMTEVHII